MMPRVRSVPQLLPVQVCVLRISGQPLGPLLHNGMPGTGVSRDHHVLGNVLLIGGFAGTSSLPPSSTMLWEWAMRVHSLRNTGVSYSSGKLEGPFGKCPCLL